jgi:aspartate racemase
VHEVIYNELCLGRVERTSRQKYVNVIDRLVSHGAEAIILGCTEIGMLVGANDSDVPLFDTTRIHAESAVALALEAD